MKGQPIRLSSVYSLLILIPLVTACQSESEREFALPEEEIRNSVQQAGTSVEHSETPSEASQLEDPLEVSVDSSTPRLLGFAIHDPMHTVAAEYGKAEEQYTMEDGSEVIIVHNYPGFTVGFNEQKGIHFIDVYSPEVEPGLDGVRIGSTTDEVLSLLGEPTQQTASVIMYEYAGTVLKLDVDHTFGTIVSIKLFASASASAAQ